MSSLVSHQLAAGLQEAARTAVARGLLPQVDLPEVIVERPQRPEHGDYASSLPLKLARATRLEPLGLAELLVQLLEPLEAVGKVSVAPPGFINYTLSDTWLQGQVEAISHAGERWGNLDMGAGQQVQIEFVSVNPTGPMHVGHGRGGVLGSALSNVLSAAGYQVVKEYYINDVGLQIELFGRSLYARYLQALGREAELPTEGYQGEYMKELAQELISQQGSRFLELPELEGVQQLSQWGQARILEGIKADLELAGVTYDIWFRESDLYESQQLERVMTLLRQQDFLAHKEGAQWFVSSSLGEDKDDVLIRSTGAPTYFASDAAYHYNKFIERKFGRVINIWGADHRGHIPRMKAVVKALGIDSDRLDIITYQLVTLKRGGEVIRVSKRSGNMITFREVLEEVGPDACRFFFLTRSPDSQMEFDLELAKRESQENPVYYVQYAHARIASILRLAQERGMEWRTGNVSLLSHPSELSLIRKMLLLPELVESIALTLEPHHLSHYAVTLADAFHQFYEQCRVLTQEQELTQARLKLAEAAKTVLARTLNLMGMTTPEKM